MEIPVSVSLHSHRAQQLPRFLSFLFVCSMEREPVLSANVTDQ